MFLGSDLNHKLALLISRLRHPRRWFSDRGEKQFSLVVGRSAQRGLEAGGFDCCAGKSTKDRKPKLGDGHAGGADYFFHGPYDRGYQAVVRESSGA